MVGDGAGGPGQLVGSCQATSVLWVPVRGWCCSVSWGLHCFAVLPEISSGGFLFDGFLTFPTSPQTSESSSKKKKKKKKHKEVEESSD